MMNEQKFKRGNLVKIKQKYRQEDIIGFSTERGIFNEQNKVLTDESNRFAIIEGSYADLYPDYNDKNIDDYSIIFLDTGYSHAWFKENELEYIAYGSEKLFEQAKVNNKLYKEMMGKEI